MNKLIAVLFLLVCQHANAISDIVVDDPVNYDFRPSKPITMTNTKGQNVQYICEMHVNAGSDNTLLIKQLNGNSVVNGTSLEKGRTLYLTVRQLQTMTVLVKKGAVIQFTNIGTYLIRGVCYQ